MSALWRRSLTIKECWIFCIRWKFSYLWEKNRLQRRQNAFTPLSWISIKFWGRFGVTATLFTVNVICVLALAEEDFGGHTAIYWEVKFPFPLSNRDVSFRQRAFRAFRLPAGGTFNQSEVSMCTWGSAETWTWTGGRSGSSWPAAPRRRRVRRRAAWCGSVTTTRAWPWRATEAMGPEVTEPALISPCSPHRRQN